MTDTQRPWDRRTPDSDPAYDACAAYLDTGSLRDAYRQRSGKVQATSAPGAWTGWSTKYNWVSRRAAYVEFTVRECQDATQVGLVQIRKRLTTRRLWCGESHAHGPHARLRPRHRANPHTNCRRPSGARQRADPGPGSRDGGTGDGGGTRSGSDAANALLDDGGIPAVRAASRIVRETFPPVEKVADVSDAQRIEDLQDVPDATLEEMRGRKLRELVRRMPLARAALCLA